MPKRNFSDVTTRIRAQRHSGEFSSAKNEYIVGGNVQKVATPTSGKTILAIDPGGSTGLAVRMADGSWHTSTVTTPAELWDFIATKPDEVVFERFATSGRVDYWMLYTIELVGGIKALTHALGIKAFIRTPGMRYAYMKQAEEMLHDVEHTVHEVDALAHLLAHEGRPVIPF